MNIFHLDSNLKLCAQYHNDAHVSKMILEGAQLIASVLHNIDLSEEERLLYLPRNKEGEPYGAGYKNHPCARWASASLENFQYLYDYTVALGKEYKYRSDREHASYVSVVCRTPLYIRGDAFPSLALTVPPNCTAIKQTANGEALEAFSSWPECIDIYRKYYVWYKDHLARWTSRPKPQWYAELEKQKLSDRWYLQMKESGNMTEKKKRRLKVDVINELPQKVKDNIPNLEKLTVAQLEGLLKIA